MEATAEDPPEVIALIARGQQRARLIVYCWMILCALVFMFAGLRLWEGSRIIRSLNVYVEERDALWREQFNSIEVNQAEILKILKERH
jgi:hypothetical protein